MIELRQSTASQEVPIGPFLSSSDGNTPLPGLTIANTDIKIWKSGATTMVNKSAGGGTHMTNGVYYVVLDASDTDTLGPLRIDSHPATSLPVKVDCSVITQEDWDAKYSAGLTGYNAAEISGNAAAATSLSSGAQELEPITVGAGPSATSIPTQITGLPFTNADHYEGRNVTINRETRRINGSSGSPVVLTTDAFNSVPAQNDTGVIS